jgi:hypothetical protein
VARAKAPAKRGLPTKGLVAGRGAAPTKAPPPQSADRDRERRSLEFAARRVPVWHVSAVTLLMRLRDRSPGDEAERTAIERALAQVPPAVQRAAELNMRGEWKPL